MNLQVEIPLNPRSSTFAPWSVSSQTIREISVCDDTDRGQGETDPWANMLLMTSLVSSIIIIKPSRA